MSNNILSVRCSFSFYHLINMKIQLTIKREFYLLELESQLAIGQEFLIRRNPFLNIFYINNRNKYPYFRTAYIFICAWWKITRGILFFFVSRRSCMQVVQKADNLCVYKKNKNLTLIWPFSSQILQKNLLISSNSHKNISSWICRLTDEF